MREAVGNPLQLGLGGDFPYAGGRKTATVFQPRLPVYLPIRPPSPPEQASLIDKRIAGELPQLRAVKKGNVVSLETADHHFTRVFLKEDAILGREPQKEHPSRFNYYLRVPVVVESVGYGRIWSAKQGRYVDVFSKQRKIPKKLMPEIMPRLRRYTKV